MTLMYGKNKLSMNTYDYIISIYNNHGDLKYIQDHFHELIQSCIQQHTLYPDDIKHKDNIVQLLLFTAYIRDKHEGFGERQLSYEYIFVWYNYLPSIAFFLLNRIVYSYPIQNIEFKNDRCFTSQSSFGSWKDIRNFATFIKDKTKNNNHDLIQFASHMLLHQLLFDYVSVIYNPNFPISLVANCFPRENNKKLLCLFRNIFD